MKLLRNICIALMLCVPAFAWNCTVPGQIRVQVPTGTVGSGTGDGSGQVVVDSGLTFECEALPTATPAPTTSTSTATSGATSGSISGANATGGSSTANGGNSTSGVNGSGNSSSTSKGGSVSGSGNSTTSTGSGSVSGINLAPVNTGTQNTTGASTSTSTGGAGGAGGAGGSISGSANNTNKVTTTVDPKITTTTVVAPTIDPTISGTVKLSNSGNSSNKNTNTNVAQGGSANGNGSNNKTTANSNQSQSQSNKSSNANNSAASATGNGANSNNTTNNVAAPVIPVAAAYAPTAFPTAPCFKGFSGGAQTGLAGVSFGGGKIDENCAKLEVARSYGIHGSDVAYCKLMVTNKYSKESGVTFEDCMVLRAVTTTTVAPAIIPAVVPVPEAVVLTPISIGILTTEAYQGFYTKLDNVAKAHFDSTVLLLKGNMDSHLRLRFNSENAGLVEIIEAYLIENGIDRERIETRDDGAEKGVEVIYID